MGEKTLIPLVGDRGACKDAIPHRLPLIRAEQKSGLPHIHLWQAVLSLLIEDAFAHVSDRKPYHASCTDAAMAYASIVGFTRDYQTLCERAGFEPAGLRAGFLRMVRRVEAGEPAPRRERRVAPAQ